MTYCSRCKSRRHMTLKEFQDHDQLTHEGDYEAFLPRKADEAPVKVDRIAPGT